MLFHILGLDLLVALEAEQKNAQRMKFGNRYETLIFWFMIQQYSILIFYAENTMN